MLTRKELDALRKALPEKGIQRISEKTGYSYYVVQKALTEPKRFKQEIIDAALEVREEYEQKIAAIKRKIKTIKP